MAKKKADEVQSGTGYTAPAPKTGTAGPATGTGDKTVTSASTTGASPKPKGVGTSQVSGGSSTSSTSSSTTTTTGGYTGEMPAVPESTLGEMPTIEHETVPDAPDLKPYLDQWLTAAQQQANNQIDYATQQGITELERAQEDAQPQFQQMRDQIAADEATAMDNQALYAEARGDRGGIGQAQWSAIQNTAAQNRLQVQQQQTKMATDTARAIADLRAKGEFEKADKALELTQSYLSQLMQLEQWAASYNMNAAQFRESLKQFDLEYQTKWLQLVNEDAWNRYNAELDQYRLSWQQWTDQRDYEADQAYRTWQQETDQRDFDWGKEKYEQGVLASAAEALLGAGIMPSESQLAALGLTKEQARSYITALQLAQYSDGSNRNPGSDDLYLGADDIGAGTGLADTLLSIGQTVVGLPGAVLSGLAGSGTTRPGSSNSKSGNPGNGGSGAGSDPSSGPTDFTMQVGPKSFTSWDAFVDYLNKNDKNLTAKERENIARQLWDRYRIKDPWNGNYGGTTANTGTGTGAANNSSGQARRTSVFGAK